MKKPKKIVSQVSSNVDNSKFCKSSINSSVYMEKAFQLAEKAFANDEVPVGAVIVNSCGEIIATAKNQCEKSNNPLLHAEMIAINKALKKLKRKYLNDCNIYVSLEPCPMCASALGIVRIRRIYFAAYDTKSGGVENGPHIFSSGAIHHTPEIYGGIMESKAGKIIKKFFKGKRST